MKNIKYMLYYAFLNSAFNVRILIKYFFCLVFSKSRNFHLPSAKQMLFGYQKSQYHQKQCFLVRNLCLPFQIAHFYLIAPSWTTTVKLVANSTNIPEVNHKSEKKANKYTTENKLVSCLVFSVSEDGSILTQTHTISFFRCTKPDSNLIEAIFTAQGA